jgi:hypothetical protein
MLIKEDAADLQDMVEIAPGEPQAKTDRTPQAAERDFKRDDDGKFATDGGGGGGGGKSTGAKSADLALPEPKIKVSAGSSRAVQEMIQEELDRGKSLDEVFKEFDNANWDYLEFAGKTNAIANVEKALDKHDAKSGAEPGTTDEIDGQHWEDWVSDNYTSPVEDKLIDQFKEQMRAKFGKQS